MNTTARLAIASSLALLFALPGHADEADGSDRALTFTSSRSAAEVQAEAAMAERVTNGGTGFIGVMQSSMTREAVAAQAAAAARNGQTSRGEIGAM